MVVVRNWGRNTQRMSWQVSHSPTMSMKRIETWERDGGAWQGRIRIVYSHFPSLFHTYA